MINSVFQIQFVSAQNCFLYLPQTFSKNVVDFGSKIRIYSIHQLDSSQMEPFGYFSAQLSSSLSHASVGLNSIYARHLKISERERISLTEVSYIAPVAKVFVTPYSKDDLEILENCMNEVEQHLLSQLRVVWPNQIFPIWISKSLSVYLKVDSIEPNVAVGCLEQFSELIINCTDFVKPPTNIGNYQNHEDESTKMSVSNCPTTSLPIQTSFKEYFRKEIHCLLSDETVSCLERIRKPSVFRIHPSSALLQFPKTRLLSHPYNLFIHRKHLPKLWALRPKPLHCEVTKVQLVLANESASKSKEEKDKTSGNVTEINAKLKSEIVFEGIIHAALHVIEEIDERMDQNESVPRHGCVYVSAEVMEMLCLSVCDRVKLEICDISNNVLDERTDVFISSPENLVSEDEEENLKNQLKNYFLTHLETSDKFLLNPISLVSIPSCNCDIKLVLKISSNKSKCFLLAKDSLKHLNLQVLSTNNIKFEMPTERNDDGISLNLDYIYHKHLDKIISEGQNLLRLSLQLDEKAVFTVFRTSNFLITGSSGSGKTTTAKLIYKNFLSAPYFVYCKYFSCKTLKGKTFDKIEKALKQCLVECVYHEPSILFLDDFETIGNAVILTHDNYLEFLHSNKIAKIFKDLLNLAQSMFSVTVIATADSAIRLNEEIMPIHGTPIFNVKFEIPELTKDNRIEILTSALPNRMFDVGFKIDFDALASKTENYVIQDFSDLCRKIKFVAWKEAAERKSNHLVTDDTITKALESIVPLGLRGVNLKKDEHISWDTIGGMKDIKQALTEYLIWPSRYPEIFSQNPLKIHSGILLFGMPGTGKTLIASSLTSECKMNFISIKGPELLSKFIGASEEGVRNIFKKAESAKPCILFFDEFDSLAPRRGQDNTGVTDRVVNQLLTQLDGVESLNGVTVIAATSRPDLIDPALLRPGRLHYRIHCPLPNESDRFQILEKLSAQLPLAADVDLLVIAKLAEDFTGADLRGLLYNAQMNAADEANSEDQAESQAQNKFQEGTVTLIISQKHLMTALTSTEPSVSQKERQKYQNIYKSFISSKKDGESTNQTTLPQRVILA